MVFTSYAVGFPFEILNLFALNGAYTLMESAGDWYFPLYDKNRTNERNDGRRSWGLWIHWGIRSDRFGGRGVYESIFWHLFLSVFCSEDTSRSENWSWTGRMFATSVELNVNALAFLLQS